MAYAINIRSNNASSQPITALWQTCARLENSPSMEALDYPPHITFAIYDDLPLADLFHAFDTAFEHQSKLVVRFDSLNYFEAPDAIVLWASPMPSEALAAIHESIHLQIEANLCSPNYRPNSWVPHCTLATAIDPSRKEEAVAFTERPIEPLEVIFDVADCASFLPVEVLREKALSDNA